MPNDVIARAFELARNGTCHSIEEIRRVLQREGYSNVHGHFDSKSLKTQLRALLDMAKPTD